MKSQEKTQSPKEVEITPLAGMSTGFKGPDGKVEEDALPPIAEDEVQISGLQLEEEGYELLADRVLRANTIMHECYKAAYQVVHVETGAGQIDVSGMQPFGHDVKPAGMPRPVVHQIASGMAIKIFEKVYSDELAEKMNFVPVEPKKDEKK
jgi:hypothetical protein